MKKYLYDAKNIEPRCGLCEHGVASEDAELILCKRKKTRDSGDKCRKFRYDPLKRQPKRTPKLPDFDPEDFLL